MNKKLTLVLGGFLLLTVVGCGTIKGVGTDVGTVGKWLTHGSDTVQEGRINK